MWAFDLARRLGADSRAATATATTTTTTTATVHSPHRPARLDALYPFLSSGELPLPKPPLPSAHRPLRTKVCLREQSTLSMRVVSIARHKSKPQALFSRNERRVLRRLLLPPRLLFVLLQQSHGPEAGHPSLPPLAPRALLDQLICPYRQCSTVHCLAGGVRRAGGVAGERENEKRCIAPQR